ncbi:hypothetical protein VTJ04DRAFT_9975 [Mycothermus thermophilus]|uniref:uncharacterized protein n=1 Tax=Humicola insolens TaxID=85995 RepID=UPI003743E35E
MDIFNHTDICLHSPAHDWTIDADKRRSRSDVHRAAETLPPTTSLLVLTTADHGRAADAGGPARATQVPRLLLAPGHWFFS